MSNSEPLSGADIASLHAEQGAIHVHVGGTAIFEGKPPAYEAFLAHVDQRLNLIPRFRQRVRHLPGKVGRPVWEDDADFDLRRHVRHAALPEPGSDEQLKELVGRIMSEPLDQDRPLWQIYLIENLNGKRFAAVSKTHHALVDGIAAVDVGAVILDPDPNGTDLGLPSEPWTPNTSRTDQMLLQRVVGARERFLGLSRETASRHDSVRRRLDDDGGGPHGPRLPRARPQLRSGQANVPERGDRPRPPRRLRQDLARGGQGGGPRLRRDRQRRDPLGLDRRAAPLLRAPRRAGPERVRRASSR